MAPSRESDLPDWAIAAAFRELDNCQNHTNDECSVYNEIFNCALEKHRAQLQQPTGGAVGEALVTVCGSTNAGKPTKVSEAFRGLETPRRMKAVELLLSLGYQWDGTQWSEPQQPAEAVAVDLEQFRHVVQFYREKSGSWAHHTADPKDVAEADRLLAIIDNAPPAIDIGKLRDVIERRIKHANTLTDDSGWEIGRKDAILGYSNELLALIGDTKE